MASRALLDLPASDGVLPDKYLLEAIDVGVIEAGDFRVPQENVQPASIDLRLGDRAYRLQCSFLPGDDSVEHKLKHYEMDVLDLRDDGAVLEPNRPYLIPLKERLALPEDIRARANPKSSTGRLDVFTRVIADGSFGFDEIRQGYGGPLYLEVVPLSFPIRVKQDLTLNQLRLIAGNAQVDDEELRRIHAVDPLLFAGDVPVRAADLALANGLFLSLDLFGENGHVGYRARDNAPLIDLTREGQIEPGPYWDSARSDEGVLILAPKQFYLLMSNEAVRIPPDLAAEMTAYDPTSGELRTHYAGFFDPGFGYDPAQAFLGSRAALEVRAHDVAFAIEHGQRVCKLTFEKMMEKPLLAYGQRIGSSYQQQEETLSKHFVRRVARSRLEDDAEQLSLLAE
ncbi:MAG: 2'-deoxycytidine 5'-triphosphate deaminase [Acidimicrobiales bacterium]